MCGLSLNLRHFFVSLTSLRAREIPKSRAFHETFPSRFCRATGLYLKRAGSLLLLFQRTPAAQVLLPEMNLASTLASSGIMRTAITTVAGLGAFDSVAGATTLSQIAPSRGASTVTGRVGQQLTVIFQITGTPTPPLGWELESGEVPGLELTYNSGEGIAALIGEPTEPGTFPIRVLATHGPDVFGRNFTVTITGPQGAVISSHPTSRTVNFGESVTLTVNAGGAEPLSYQWYEGISGDVSQPVGGDENTFTTPSLESTTSYWVQISNSLATVDSRTAEITVRPPAPVIQEDFLTQGTIGAAYTHSVTASNTPAKFSITGLPRGLKANASTGIITGRPEVSGRFEVKIRATNAGGSSPVVNIPLMVDALNPGLIGTFGGLIGRDSSVNRGVGGSLTLTTTTNGSFTLKATTVRPASATRAGAATYSLRGRLDAALPQISATLGGLPLQLSLNAETGEVTGSLGTASITGWRAAHHATLRPAEDLTGYYSAALRLADLTDRGNADVPQGSGFFTFTVGAGGTLTCVGRTADGQAFSSASFLGSEGQFWLYARLYRNLGSLHGGLNLTTDPEGVSLGNVINGDLTWQKPTVNERAYPAGFGPLNVKAEGAYLAPASRGHFVSGLPETGTMDLQFSGGGIGSSMTNPDLSLTFTEARKVLLPSAAENPAKLTLKLNPATGALSGTFTLTDGTLRRSRVAFRAQVVRGADGEVKAEGSFLLPQLADIGQAANRTPILSGGIELRQGR